MKNEMISKERKKYLRKNRANKFFILLTQILIIIRIFRNLGATCGLKGNRQLYNKPAK